MHATVLVILCDGQETLAVCNDAEHAWSELMAFIDGRWEARYGPALPPDDEAQRARAFFLKDENYLIASADLSELANALADE